MRPAAGCLVKRQASERERARKRLRRVKKLRKPPGWSRS